MLFARDRMRRLHSSHGWDHVERVVRLALHIAATEPSADPFIVHASALLHDIARREQDESVGAVCHAETGSGLAYDFLVAQGLDGERAEMIRHCVLTHRFRNDRAPESVEARILYDADKLDSIGAVGIGRAFLFSGEVGARLHNTDGAVHLTEAYSSEDTAFREFTVKLRHVRDRMLTAEGRRLAEERHEFMEEFFERLRLEIAGEE